MNESQTENERLRILNEVNVKFNEVLDELNGKGTEFSRSLAKEIEAMKNTTAKELDNLWSWSKSKMVSIEQGQKLFYGDIFPKLMNKVGAAVDMSRDSAMCTAAALKSVEKAEGFVKDSRKYILVLMTGLFAVLLPLSIASIMKLVQDKNNQIETVSYLRQLNRGIKIDGMIDSINGLSKKKRKAILDAINKP